MKKPTKPLPYEMNPFNVFAAFNEPFANAMAQTTSAFTKGLQSVQGEMAEFTAKRLRHDAETFYRSSCCENYEELSQIQQKWISDTTEDYMEEAGRVMGLSQSVFNQMSEAGNTWAEGLSEVSTPAMTREGPAEAPREASVEVKARPTPVEKSESVAAAAAKRAASEGVSQRSKAAQRASESPRKAASTARSAATELPSTGKVEGDANGGISTDV